jgi:hypothetical protein
MLSKNEKLKNQCWEKKNLYSWIFQKDFVFSSSKSYSLKNLLFWIFEHLPTNNTKVNDQSCRCTSSTLQRTVWDFKEVRTGYPPGFITGIRKALRCGRYQKKPQATLSAWWSPSTRAAGSPRIYRRSMAEHIYPFLGLLTHESPLLWIDLPL